MVVVSDTFINTALMNNRSLLRLPARVLSSDVGSRSFSSSQNMVRLSKRMSELNLCSRRQADQLILSSSVLLEGQVVQPILGQKIPSNVTDISILTTSAHSTNTDDNNKNQYHQHSQIERDPLGNPGDTIVLNKPINYVSGQPDPRHKHIPAVRLLTRSNIYTPTKELQEVLSNGNYLHFAKKFPKRRRGRDVNVEGDSNGSGTHNAGKENNDTERVSTLVNYAPAGRLDLDSSGLLIFTKNGVIAKNVLNSRRMDIGTDGERCESEKVDKSSPSSSSSTSSNLITKEYYVKVEPIQSLTRDERRKGMDERRLPLRPIWDLSSLLGKQSNSGRDDQGRRTRIRRRLWNESTNLRPLVEAEWVEEGRDKNGAWNGKGTIRMVLQEGRKRQIRRMCRELLGLHVVDLKRTRIGGISLGDLPVGRWRPLTKEERESLLYPGSCTKTSKLHSNHDENYNNGKSGSSSIPKHARAALEVIAR